MESTTTYEAGNKNGKCIVPGFIAVNSDSKISLIGRVKPAVNGRRYYPVNYRFGFIASWMGSSDYLQSSEALHLKVSADGQVDTAHTILTRWSNFVDSLNGKNYAKRFLSAQNV